LDTAVVAGNVEGLRLARGHLHAIRLDQHIDHESAASVALAVQTMAAMREQRPGGEPVAHLTARAASRALGHATSSTTTWRL
jgi:hypothetical protein